MKNQVLPWGGWLGPVLGAAAAGLLTVILSLPVALAVYFGPWSEQALPLLARIIRLLALLAAGYIAGRAAGSRGLLMGAGAGLLFMAISGLVGGWENYSILAALAGLAAAIAGGVAGVR